MSTILVTGSSGYIGHRLAARLKQQGHTLIGLDRVAPRAGAALDEFIEADLLDIDRYEHILQRVDQICHLAAAKGDWGISEAEYLRDNVEATLALLTASRKARVSSWIFYSTVSALGPSVVPLSEDAPHAPINPYGASKAKCEDLYAEYSRDFPDASITIIRPSVVFGPENPWNTNIFRLVDAVYRNRFLMIGKGDALKTTSYADNLIAAHLFLADRQRSVGHRGIDVYQYVDEPVWSTARLVEYIRQKLGKRGVGMSVPLAIAAPLALVGDAAATVLRIDLPITSARIRKFCTSTNFSSKKVRDLGFTQPTRMEDAMDETIAWYLQSRSDQRPSSAAPD